MHSNRPLDLHVDLHLYLHVDLKSSFSRRSVYMYNSFPYKNALWLICFSCLRLQLFLYLLLQCDNLFLLLTQVARTLATFCVFSRLQNSIH